MGNIRLTRKGLGILYPPKAIITDLTFTPKHPQPPKHPNYIYLECRTKSIDHIISIGITCNPSPPGRSSEENEPINE